MSLLVEYIINKIYFKIWEKSLNKPQKWIYKSNALTMLD